MRSESASEIAYEFDVPDFHLPQACLAVLVQVDVDGEMGVDISHLVSETLRDAYYEVCDDGLDRS